MVLAHYLRYIPFRLRWQWARRRGRLAPLAFFVGEPLDYDLMAPVLRHLPGAVLMAADRRVHAALAGRGIACRRYPVFARTVVMARHARHWFPEPAVRTVGMRHGAHVFKQFIRAERYNAFDRYLATSADEVALGEARGIRTLVPVGYPKLDPAFDGTMTPSTDAVTRRSLGLADGRPVVLFSATWEGSGMSALERWAHRLAELPADWHVLVTVHAWTSGAVLEAIRRTPAVRLLAGHEVLPALRVADVVVADTSSIIAEASALDRPLVTFRVPAGPRTPPHLEALLDELSERIDRFEELAPALERARLEPGRRAGARAAWNRRFFDRLDGRAGERAAAVIRAVSEGAAAR